MNQIQKDEATNSISAQSILKRMQKGHRNASNKKVRQMRSLIDRFLSNTQNGMSNWTDFSYFSDESEIEQKKSQFTCFDLHKGTYSETDMSTIEKYAELRMNGEKE